MYESHLNVVRNFKLILRLLCFSSRHKTSLGSQTLNLLPCFQSLSKTGNADLDSPTDMRQGIPSSTQRHGRVVSVQHLLRFS